MSHSISAVEPEISVVKPVIIRALPEDPLRMQFCFLLFAVAFGSDPADASNADWSGGETSIERFVMRDAALPGTQNAVHQYMQQYHRTAWSLRLLPVAHTLSMDAQKQ